MNIAFLINNNNNIDQKTKPKQMLVDVVLSQSVVDLVVTILSPKASLNCLSVYTLYFLIKGHNTSDKIAPFG